MQRESFWALVYLLKVGGDKYWCQCLGSDASSWTVHQQVAIDLYILGAGPSSTAERSRIKLNIAVCYLVFSIPLHAARRAMAAVVAVYNNQFSLTQTDRTGHSRAPSTP